MIVRSPRPDGNFYVLDKRISEDRALSWAARGLLVYLLGKPDHWQVSPAALINETAGSTKPLGRDGVLSLLSELIAAGYCSRTPRRNADGTMAGNDFRVSEHRPPAKSKPDTEAPETANPDTAEPDAANPEQVSIEKKASTENTARIDYSEKPVGSKSATKADKPTKTAKPKVGEPVFDASTGKFDGIEQSVVDLWQEAHPGIDVRTEISRASCWLIANPERAKTRLLRFLNNWMTNASGRPSAAPGAATRTQRPLSEKERHREEWAVAMRQSQERAQVNTHRSQDHANIFDV